MNSESLIGNFISVLLGGVIVALIGWARGWRGDKASAQKTETEGFKILREETEQAVQKGLQAEREKNKLLIEAANKDFLLQLKDAQLEDNRNNFKDVFVELGSTRKAEEICQKRLNEKDREDEKKQRQIDDLQRQINTLIERLPQPVN